MRTPPSQLHKATESGERGRRGEDLSDLKTSSPGTTRTLTTKKSTTPPRTARAGRSANPTDAQAHRNRGTYLAGRTKEKEKLSGERLASSIKQRLPA